MKIEYSINNHEVIKELDRLAVELPAKTGEAADAMAEVILPALIANAPFDGSAAHKDKHLKEVINVTKRKNSVSNERVIWVSPRGVAGAVKGKRARKNWDKDKHIYKLVTSEYGRSDLPAQPFWTPTIEKNSEAAVKAAIGVLKKEIE